MEKPHVEKHHHHILPNKTILIIGGCLLFLTAVTVWVAQIDLGKLNFVVAMLVASIKASLVALFFMNLKYDRRENGVIFSTSFLFLAIFIVLTGTDLFFRGDVYVKGPLMADGGAQKSKLKNPWIATPELIAHGRELFAQNCVACHGANGMGDGPAAAALKPPPRNFHSAEGWDNGRHPSDVFKTLREGVSGTGMASFSTLPVDDRWALAQYVLSLGPRPPGDNAQTLAKNGVSTTGEVQEAPTIPIALAMERMEQPPTPAEARAHPYHPSSEAGRATGTALVYENRCAQCHGDRGEGGIKVRNLGVYPAAFVTTEAFHGASEALRSQDTFGKVVSRGMPGELMPGNGQLSSNEMRELFGYVKSLAR